MKDLRRKSLIMAELAVEEDDADEDDNEDEFLVESPTVVDVVPVPVPVSVSLLSSSPSRFRLKDFAGTCRVIFNESLLHHGRQFPRQHLWLFTSGTAFWHDIRADDRVYPTYEDELSKHIS